MHEHSRKLNAHVFNRVIQAWGEVTYSVHVRRSDHPCIWHCNNNCLLFNATLVLSFTPDFGDTASMVKTDYSVLPVSSLPGVLSLHKILLP